MNIISLFLLMAVASGNFQNDGKLIVPAAMPVAKEVIKVYQTPGNKGSITVNSANREPLSFYLFDLEGKLIYQTSIRHKEMQVVEGLANGTYLYNAFKNDENLEEGKIILK